MNVLDVMGSPVAGAWVVAEDLPTGAATTNPSGAAVVGSFGTRAVVDIFSPHVATTPQYYPAVFTAAGVTGSTFTTRELLNVSAPSGTISVSFTGYQNASNTTRLLFKKFAYTSYGGGLPQAGSTYSQALFPGTYHLSAWEMAGSTPVTAGFETGISISSGATTNVTVALTPVSSLAANPSSITFTTVTGYNSYGAIAGGGSSSAELYRLPQDSMIPCSTGCTITPTFWSPGSYSYFLTTAGASGFFGNGFVGSTHYFRSSIPTAQTETALPPATGVTFPAGGNGTISLTNPASTTATVWRFLMMSLSTSTGWTVIGPGPGPAAVASAVYPQSFPAGVPASYRPVVGTTMYTEAWLEFLLPGPTFEDLPAEYLVSYMDRLDYATQTISF